MTLGGSAGRSQNNPTRAEARRRFTEREREKNTPLKDDPNVWPDGEVNTNRKIASVMASFIFTSIIFTLSMYYVATAESSVWRVIAALTILTNGLSVGMQIERFKHRNDQG